MSIFEKLYNLASKSYRLVVVVFVFILLLFFASIEIANRFNGFASHPLVRFVIVLILIFLGFALYVVIVNSYLEQERQVGKTPSYKKFKKKFVSILVWYLIIGISSVLFAGLVNQ